MPLAESGDPSPGADATEVYFRDLSEVELAFDHERIIAAALAGLRT
ncbi:MAG TPA: hypothetical protein VK361_10980 [Rubrobacteraceae bacterium]|nr:hypothetical protein [Rubrobacteraceae bacterium]